MTYAESMLADALALTAAGDEGAADAILDFAALCEAEGVTCEADVIPMLVASGDLLTLDEMLALDDPEGWARG